MNRLKRFFSGDNLCSLGIGAALILCNIAIFFGCGLQEFTFETRKLTALQIILSAVLYLLYIAFCILMRAKKYSRLAKGIFYYQLVGSVAYILYFFHFVFQTGLGGLAYSVFHAWTLPFSPVMVAIGRITGIRAKYLEAICYLILTFTTGKTIIAIRKDKAYEKKYQEDHCHEKKEIQ